MSHTTAQGGWGSAPREVNQPGWAILAVHGRVIAENPAMAPEIPERLKVV